MCNTPSESPSKDLSIGTKTITIVPRTTELQGFEDDYPYSHDQLTWSVNPFSRNNSPNNSPVRMYNIPFESLLNNLSIDAKINPIDPRTVKSQGLKGCYLAPMHHNSPALMFRHLPLMASHTTVSPCSTTCMSKETKPSPLLAWVAHPKPVRGLIQNIWASN